MKAQKLSSQCPADASVRVVCCHVVYETCGRHVEAQRGHTHFFPRPVQVQSSKQAAKVNEIQLVEMCVSNTLRLMCVERTPVPQYHRNICLVLSVCVSYNRVGQSEAFFCAEKKPMPCRYHLLSHFLTWLTTRQASFQLIFVQHLPVRGRAQTRTVKFGDGRGSI